jgi:hypothetical protein
MRVSKQIIEEFNLPPTADSAGAAVVIRSDGSGRPGAIRIGNAELTPEVVERAAEALRQRRAKALTGPYKYEGVCVEHGYFEASWSGDECSACNPPRAPAAPNGPDPIAT